MINSHETLSETSALAEKVVDRYGRLALTRAASQASAAQRQGNAEDSERWFGVVSYLRQSLPLSSAAQTA